MSDTPELLVETVDRTMWLTFNRPQARNAMTWSMWEGLGAAAAAADADPNVRAVVLRGAGGQSFVAGTDISQFSEFTSGEDGIAYEEKVSGIIDALATIRKPTVAVIEGFCVGGGLAIAASCDLRIAAPGARFGVPVARTLGNCLSMNTYALLVHHLGPSRTLSMLMTAELMGAEDAAAAGFVTPAEEDLDAQVDRLLRRLSQHAPLSMWAAKEAVYRLRTHNLPESDDIVRTVFGSEDFAHGVTAFTSKTTPDWKGR